MKKPVFLLCIILAVVVSSCSSDRKIMKDLSDIESFLGARPDSALASIRSIDTLQLKTKAEKAKYALLHAMALDKNYIDTADTRIVMPAVEYYEKHGSPEEKLKAYMYLGTEQYCGGLYNQSIVSFSQAEEQAPFIKDHNLLGVLFSKMADTFSMTRDYFEAGDYIDKSLEQFCASGRKDQAFRQNYRKAQNLVNLQKWDDAFILFQELLNTPSVSFSLKQSIESNFAMALLTAPNNSDSLAFVHFNNVFRGSGKFNNINQLGAFAYTLDLQHYREQADSVLNSLLLIAGSNNIYYSYWKHRIDKNRGNFKEAYLTLWESLRLSDSIKNDAIEKSAHNAQIAYFEKKAIEEKLFVQEKEKKVESVLWLLLLFIIIAAILIWKRKNDLNKERDRTIVFLDSLKKEVSDLKEEKNANKSAYLESEKLNTRAKFAYLANLYEVIHLAGDDDDDKTLHRLYRIIKGKIKNLTDNPEATVNFEKLLNKESNNIMVCFRKDFQGLSDKDYRLASYIFAGFDNTTLMLLFNSSPSNTRVMKSRLKTIVANSQSENKDRYLSFWS